MTESEIFALSRCCRCKRERENCARTQHNLTFVNSMDFLCESCLMLKEQSQKCSLADLRYPNLLPLVKGMNAALPAINNVSDFVI